MFSNLSRAEIYNRKVKGKSIYKIELKSTTFVKLTCVIINRNNFRARIFNQIQIPARETSRSRGFAAHRSLFEIDLWASLICGHHRTQGLFGKDPGIVWSRDSTKINCPRGSGKVSNYMLENVTVNFKYQEWDFTIHRSKRSLTSILYFCLLLNYKSTVAFYQQSSQETNKSYSLKLGILSQTYFHIKPVSRQRLYIFAFICF